MGIHTSTDTTDGRERHGWGTKNTHLQDGRYELMMGNDWKEGGWRVEGEEDKGNIKRITP